MRKEFIAGLIAGLAVVVLCAIVVLANPGGDDNPLISKSYLDNVFMSDVKQYINQQGRFNVVELQTGQKLIGKAGCELILRQGSAKIFASAKGGLADATAGNDPADGTDMPSNHLLIVPVDDGRGFEATSKILVMVKGEYTIQ